MNDIYESLKAGRSAEDLVAEFTKQLNDAEAQVKAEREAAKQAEARRIEEAARTARREDLIDVVDCFVSWAKEYYPELIDDTDLDREAQGQLADVILMMLDLKDIGTRFTSGRKIAKQETPEEIFADFFKACGL